jgi:hypothetical protein
MCGVSGLGEPPDDLDRELMQLEAGLAKPAKFHEPSAAERADVAVQPASRRTARKARRMRGSPARPVRPTHAWRSAALPLRRRRRGAQLATVLIVVTILAAAGYGFSKLAQRQHIGVPTPLPSWSALAGGLPSPTAADPFLGTPAHSYADGAAGIVIPASQPASSYSAVQVTAAYQTTKHMLVAAFLNGPTLAGGAPDAFASLLIPQQRAYFVDGLHRTGLDAHGNQNSTRTWVASFARGTRLVGDVIKVHGSMRAAASTSNGTPVLQVHADYLFVYPVERPGQPSTLMRIVDRDVVDVDFGPYGGPGTALQPWWQVVADNHAGARCDVNDGFVHPQFPNGPPDKVTPKGTPVNPYDQRTPAPSGGCTAITGT